MPNVVRMADVAAAAPHSTSTPENPIRSILMFSFILKRLASGLVVLFTVSALTFFLLYFSSGSIARNIVGDQASAAQVAAKEAELGLDQPLIVRHVSWLASAVTGDFGRPWYASEPVTQALSSRVPATRVMVFAAMLFIAVIAALLGVAAAVKRGWVDRVVQVGAIVGDAIPGFVIGIVLVTFLANQLKIFPATSTIAPDASADAYSEPKRPLAGR